MHQFYLFAPHFFNAGYLPVPDTTISYLAVSYSSSTSDCFPRPYLSQKQSAGSLPSRLCQRHFWDHFGDVATYQEEFNTLVLFILLGNLLEYLKMLQDTKTSRSTTLFRMDQHLQIYLLTYMGVFGLGFVTR